MSMESRAGETWVAISAPYFLSFVGITHVCNFERTRQKTENLRLMHGPSIHCTPPFMHFYAVSSF